MTQAALSVQVVPLDVDIVVEPVLPCKDNRQVGWCSVESRSHTRGVALTTRLLTIAQELLVAEGYSKFSMEAVAKAAGVSRSTLYRRWASKQELVVACAHTLDVEALRAQDLGSFEADVRHLIMTRLALVRTGAYAAAQAALLAATTEVPELHKQVVAKILLKLQVTDEIICRGQERGDVSSAVDASVLRLLISAPMLFSVLHLGQNPNQVFVDSLVELVTRAAAPDTGTGKVNGDPAEPVDEAKQVIAQLDAQRHDRRVGEESRLA